MNGVVPASVVDEKKIAKLLKIRKTDKSAFICVWCGKIDVGWGARIGNGWACSNECYDLEADRLLKVEHPALYL